MDKIWIVMGSTGEYSDRYEWAVEAHASEDAAKARVERLTTLLQEVSGGDSYTRRRKTETAVREHPEGDPSCHIDYTGTSYSYTDCKFVS